MQEATRAKQHILTGSDLFYGVLRLMAFGEPPIRNRIQVYDFQRRSRAWKGTGTRRGAET